MEFSKTETKTFTLPNLETLPSSYMLPIQSIRILQEDGKMDTVYVKTSFPGSIMFEEYFMLKGVCKPGSAYDYCINVLRINPSLVTVLNI